MKTWMSFAMLCVLPGPLVAQADDCVAASSAVRQGAALGDGSKAEEASYQKALTLCPSLADAHYNLGLNLTKQKRWDEAMASFRRALDLDLDSAYALGLGGAAVQKGDLDTAEKAYSQALKLQPEIAQAYQGLSVVYQKRGENQKAEDALRQAIQINPKDATSFYNLGVLLDSLGRTAEAVVSFQAATEKGTDKPNDKGATDGDKDDGKSDAFLALGNSLLKLGREPEAERALKAAHRLDPDSVNVLVALAAVYERMQNLPEAQELLQKAMLLDNKNRATWANLGVVLFKMGRRKEGLDLLQKGAAQFSDSAQLHGSYGWALLQERNFTQAERELSLAIRLDENNSFAHNNLGVLYELRGDKERSLRHYDRAKRLNADLGEASDNARRVSAE